MAFSVLRTDVLVGIGPIKRPGRLVALTKDVLKKEPEPGRRLLFWEDVLYKGEDLGNGVQVEHFGELPDVLCVTGPSSERLHGKQVFW